MTPYTVTWQPSCEADLAQYWLADADRERITRAANGLDRLLRENPSQRGVELREGLRALTVPPLRAIFTVSEEDRLVEVWQIRVLS